jgi:phage-related tail fiber protein
MLWSSNGNPYSRATYAPLFSAIGTTFGAGDGSTTFNVLDLRAEFIRGVDAGRGVDVDRVLGSSQAESLKQHGHDAVIQNESISIGAGITSGGYQPRMVTGTTGLTGGAETRPRNVALTPCIKY